MIPVDLRIELVGRRNGMVSKCVNYEYSFEAKDGNVTPYIIGFAETTYGKFVVWECPKCFQKQYFHYMHSIECGYDYVKSLQAFKDENKDWLIKELI